jgi:hypothetical protein
VLTDQLSSGSEGRWAALKVEVSDDCVVILSKRRRIGARARLRWRREALIGLADHGSSNVGSWRRISLANMVVCPGWTRAECSDDTGRINEGLRTKTRSEGKSVFVTLQV